MMHQMRKRLFLTLTGDTRNIQNAQNRLTVWTWVALVFWTVQFFLPKALLAAEAAPRAVLTETSHDFGQIFEDRELTHTFVIRNTGQAPLEILDVHPECACTVPSYDKTIPPGGQGEITLSIKPYSVIHQFHKDTTVTTNDPENREFHLVLTGNALPFIEIEPSHIVRLRGKTGEDVRGQVKFISHLPGPFKITGYQTNIPDKIEISLKAVVPDRVYVLEVTNRQANMAPYAGIIILTTNSAQRPRLIVRVFGEIYLPSAVGR
ncbi:MAG: DUF1573 domain-containing protein [Desulfobaccales bacterium]